MESKMESKMESEMESMEIVTIKRKSTETSTRKPLTEIEKVAYKIAKKHLGSSFDIKKSNGFQKERG